MWQIEEHHVVDKVARHLPPAVHRKYELWKTIVARHGPDKLREFPGFHDEKLKGTLAGQRSSRLNIQYRVIYRIDRDIVAVYVIEITPHNY